MSAKDPEPPAPAVLLAFYTLLGTIISFAFGREPTSVLTVGNDGPNMFVELAPTILVICGFLTSYSLYDCMAVGLAKRSANLLHQTYLETTSAKTPAIPEAVYLAQRAQTNQVEQLPGFIVGALACAFLVNGTVAAVLALLWSVLRRGYARQYRRSVGKRFCDMGLAQYTVPAYMASNALLMSAVVHGLRVLYVYYLDPN